MVNGASNFSGVRDPFCARKSIRSAGCLAREEIGQDLDRSGAIAERSEYLAKPRGEMDQRQRPARCETAQRGVDPVRERWFPPREARGRVRGRPRGGAAARWIGRVRQHEVELERPERSGRLAHVAFVDAERDAVRRGVAAGEIGVGRLQSRARAARAPASRAPRHSAAVPDAAAEIERALARAARARRPRAAPDRSRRDSPGAAATAAGGRRETRRGSGPRRRSRSRQEAVHVVVARGRRGRGRRRGRRPSGGAGTGRSPPSSTLMWTSRTKQSIPSPRNRAVEKAMIVGSVDAQDFLHGPQPSGPSEPGREASGMNTSLRADPERAAVRATAGGARRRHGRGSTR